MAALRMLKILMQTVRGRAGEHLFVVKRGEPTAQKPLICRVNLEKTAHVSALFVTVKSAVNLHGKK